MKSKSILDSIVFNFLKTLSGLIFPAIAFSYASHILGVEGIGKTNFVNSFITFFSMIAMLGMNYYGTREASKRRDNIIELNKFIREMLVINGISTFLAYALLTTVVMLTPRLKDYHILIVIYGTTVLFQGMGMEWLYQALEEYKYIAIRTLLFQLAGLVLMFLFVRDSLDVIKFAVIYVFATFGSYIINFFYMFPSIIRRQCGHIEIAKHIKPLLLLFAMAVSIQLYAVLDTTTLGFLQDDIAVGKYTAAVKINKIIVRLITSLAIVLIPRLSYYIEQRRFDKIKEVTEKSYNMVFLFSIPAAVGLFMLSKEILFVVSGEEFQTVSHTMRMLVPIVVLIPFSGVTNTQTFIPMGKEKNILCSTCIGAIVNVICNFCLIPKYAENGAAFATVLAETAVAIICFINVRKHFDMRKILSLLYQYWLAVLPMIFIIMFIRKIFDAPMAIIAISMPMSMLSYVIVLWCLRNRYFLEALHAVAYRIKQI